MTRRRFDPLRTVVRTIVAMLSLSLSVAPAAAMAQEGSGRDELGSGTDLFPEFSFGNDSAATDAADTTKPVSWSARLVPSGESGDSEGMTTGYVEVDVDLGKGWHLYSLTQPAGGPKRTRIEIEQPSGARVVEPWSANVPPKKSVSEEFGGLTVEEHDGKVRFRSKVELPEGFTGTVRVRVDAQVCTSDGSCIPVRETLTAKRGGGDSASNSESAADETVAAETKQAETKPAESEPFRDGDYVVEWKASVSDSHVRPGSRTSLRFTAIPDASYHVYTATVDDSSSSTNFVIADKDGLRIGAPATDEPVIESDLLPDTRYHQGKVTWTLPVEIPSDVAAGDRTIEGFVVYQACTDTSCQRPMAFKFTADLVVAESLPENVSSEPMRLVSAKRIEALDLAATQPWVDEIDSSTDGRGETSASGGAGGGGRETGGGTAGTAQAAGAADPDPGAKGDENLLSFPLILLLAFGGGIILNVMPCVLPVVGLKVMGFVKQAGEDRSRILMLNLAYIGGILTMFAVFATLAVSVSFGWGEQLTYFPVRLALTLLLFALALSYFGVWEIPVPGFAAGKASQDLQQREGLGGAYSKGVFATILATPCSGPLLGYILGLTLTIAAPLTFVIFMTVGVGMSLPYLIVGLRPSLISWLPKPGPWMETLKQFLAFLFLATVAFFFGTFSDDHKLPVFIALMGVWFGCWIIGQVPDWERVSKRLGAWVAGVAVAALIAVLAFQMTAKNDVLQWEPYSEARLTQLKSEGRTVLLDFGAKWCGNCIYNYETAINTEATRELIESLDAVAMYADWTDSDPEIEAKLRELGSISIPLLVIYPGSDPDNPILLRDIVTQSQVLAALEQAGPSADAGSMVAESEDSDSRSLASAGR